MKVQSQTLGVYAVGTSVFYSDNPKGKRELQCSPCQEQKTPAGLLELNEKSESASARESLSLRDHQERSADFDHFSLLMQVSRPNAHSSGRHKSELSIALVLQGILGN